jgi:hypothetical protein
LVTRTHVHESYNVFNSRLSCSKEHIRSLIESPSPLGWNSPCEREQANHLRFVGFHHRDGGFQILDARQSDFRSRTRARARSTKSSGEYSGGFEHWHQGSVKSYRILYQDAAGLGGEVRWDGNQAQPKYPRPRPF